MELKMNEYQLPEKISFNFEELKQELTEKVSHYETLVYTDEQIKEAKADKVSLNKLKKALNDERIRREKEYMVPFNAFKSQVNEIISIIDKPIAVIEKQINEYEEKKKNDKLEAINDFFDSCESVPEWLQLEKIFDPRWLNVSVSMKSIQETITRKVEQIKNDLVTLANLPEFAFEAQQTYIFCLDLGKALNEANRLSEMAKAKAAHEAEQERLKQEAGFAKHMNPPVTEEIAQSRQEYIEAASANGVHPTIAPTRQWISFAANLTVGEAMELKNFFNTHGIEYKAI